MGDNFRRRLEPIIKKLTKKGIKDGINLLKKAGSVDPLGEQQRWIQQHVDDPARMLARIDGSDQEDTSPEPESKVESDGSDIEVVVSDDESEDSGDEDTGDLDDFVAASSSSDNDEEDNASDDEEYSYEGRDEADNEEESCEYSGDDKEAELGA